MQWDGSFAGTLPERLAAHMIHRDAQTLAMTGRGRAKWDGNPTVKLLGTPGDCRVGHRLLQSGDELFRRDVGLPQETS